MVKINKFTLTAVFLFLFISQLTAQKSVFNNFITRSGNKLMDGDKEFRFISFNIPNLNYVEDEFAIDSKHAFRLPNEYEISDALKTIIQLGGNVVRVYTIPVRRNTDSPDIPTYVLAPGKFDEVSFKAMDLMFALANKIGVRIIIGVVNNWKWMGGRPQYADFRGKTEDEFWTDPQIIADVKETIRFVINRTNTITGIKYKDDKSLLCWETGNELSCPQEWTTEIVKYIKSLDQNHLVMDGFNAFDASPVREESLLDPNIDIVTSHHYETNANDLIMNINSNLKIVNYRKPYIIGEMGFNGTPAIERAMNHIIVNDISGALMWSIRSHRREGGFYWHSEPLGLGLFKAYHWPGFATGNEYDELNLLNMVRNKAFEIQGMTVPAIEKPEKPVMIECNDVSKISWQGSAGASTYDVLRSESSKGPWIIVGFNISDADVQYVPLFNDESAEFGNDYYYCVIAKNIAGSSDTSNVIGPIKIEHKTYIDDMQSFTKVYHFSGSISRQTGSDRDIYENLYRIQGENGAEMVYYRPGKITSVIVYSFAKADSAGLVLSISNDGINYSEIPFEKDIPVDNTTIDYGYWNPEIYTINNIEDNSQFLKIKFNGLRQLTRVEIKYIKEQ